MKKWYHLLLAVIVVVLNHSAYAEVVFDSGLVHIVNYPLNEGVVVQDSASGKFTMVDIYSGAEFPSYVSSEGSSLLRISGGSFQSRVYLRDDSVAEISGGDFSDRLLVQDNATVTISGDTTVAEFSGSIYSTINIMGGTFTSSFRTGHGESTIESGIFNCDVQLVGNSIVTGGYFNNSVSAELGNVTISGGTYLDNVFCALGSLVISGGEYGGYIMASGYGSLVTLSGSGFTINGQEVTEGSFASEYPLEAVIFEDRECLTGIVTGVLSDGTAFNQTIYLSDLALGRGDIQFIPEPASVWLLLLSGGWLVRRKRR